MKPHIYSFASFHSSSTALVSMIAALPNPTTKFIKHETHHDNDILVTELGEEQSAVGSRDRGEIVVVHFMAGLH